MMKEAWEQAWNETPWELRCRVQRWGTPTEWNPKTKSGRWGRRLKGERCQCGTCGDFFSGTEAFDAHRTGDWGKPGKPSKRRCLTLAEMIADGFTRNEYFYLTKNAPRKGVAVPGTHEQG